MGPPASNREAEVQERLSEAQAGNGDALAELLEHHAPRVRRALAGAIPRRWQSLLSIDDVMQQSFADAFLDIRGFVSRGADSFAAWLTAIARHNLLNALQALETRKRGGDRRPVRDASREESAVALLEMLAVTSSTPSRRLARREGLAALEAAVGKLPDSYRTVVQMYDLDRRPVDDVARVLDRTPGAVYMIRCRAHRMLADLMGSAATFFSGTP